MLLYICRVLSQGYRTVSFDFDPGRKTFICVPGSRTKDQLLILGINSSHF